MGPAHDDEDTVPVTAKLSRKFYETFGDELANELVEWFNQVDVTYRSELRELNELNFARFDAKLEQRLAEFRAEFRSELHELRVNFERRLEQTKSELLKWMFLFWVGNVATTIGLAVAVISLLRP